jgi:hypothetical protein
MVGVRRPVRVGFGQFMGNVEGFVQIALGGRVGILFQQRRIAAVIHRAAHMDAHLLIQRQAEKARTFGEGPVDEVLSDAMVLDVEEADFGAGHAQFGGKLVLRRSVLAQHRREIDDRDCVKSHGLFLSS